MLPPLTSCRKRISPPPCVNYFCPMHLSDRVSFRSSCWLLLLFIMTTTTSIYTLHLILCLLLVITRMLPPTCSNYFYICGTIAHRNSNLGASRIFISYDRKTCSVFFWAFSILLVSFFGTLFFFFPFLGLLFLYLFFIFIAFWWKYFDVHYHLWIGVVWFWVLTLISLWSL